VTATASPTGPVVLGRRRELDGLRAVAVTLVLLQHVGDLLIDEEPSFTGGPLLPGGFLGVDLFFVLSGFLITGLLLEERARHGRIRFRTFYLRRALRLLPALLVVLAGTVAYVATTDRPLRPHLAGVAGAVAYVWNWLTAWGAEVGDFGLGHLWSLSIEEQFYLAWPLALALAVALVPRWRPAPLVLCAAVLVATIASRLVLLDRGALADAYVRTDTRLDGLMVGAAASIWLHRGGRLPAWLGQLVAPALVALVVLSATATLPDRWLYAWGFTAVALVAAVIVTGTVAGTPLAGLLASGPFVWLGGVSYVLYLVHYPVFQAVGEELGGEPVGVRVAVGLGLAFAGTLACHHLVERPFLKMKDRVAARASGVAAAGGGAPGRAEPTT
jgi:peptidoglycan/LPS O-acetylase OafA/YrhL